MESHALIKRKTHPTLLVLALVANIASKVASAAPAVFGPEFTFTNYAISHGGTTGSETRNEQAAEELQSLLPDFKDQCAQSGCVVTAVRDHNGYTAYRATYPDGFWFQISTDPGTLEVQTKPLTLKEWEAHSNLVQRDLFDFMANRGLRSSPVYGGGHINIGIDAFEGNPRWLRDFFVDFSNHPGLAMGIWEDDYYNAPALYAVLERRAKQNKTTVEAEIKVFEDAIAEFDAIQEPTFKDFQNIIFKKVYTDQPFLAGMNPKRYQSINLMHILKSIEEARIEMRSHRAQRNMREFIMQITTYQKRIDYLKEHPKVKVNLSRVGRKQALKDAQAYLPEKVKSKAAQAELPRETVLQEVRCKRALSKNINRELDDGL